MANNLGCIGLSAADREQFMSLLVRLARQATEETPSRGTGRHVRWTDPSGASVAYHVDDKGSIDCVTPFFVPPDGPVPWRVRTSKPAFDPACVHCSGADCDVLDGAGELVTRATVQWLDFEPYRDWLCVERTYDLETIAFAHGAAFCDDEAEFDAVQRPLWKTEDGEEAKGTDGRPLRYAPESFTPEGMFGPEGDRVSDRATALFSGRVESTTVLKNRATGVDFRHVRVRTVPGVIDAVLPVFTDGKGPRPGQIALVRAFLVGRPAVPPT